MRHAPLVFEEVACSLCGSSRSAPFLTGPDRVHGIPGQFTLRRCLACGLIYQNPRPSAGSLAAIYPPDYGPYQDAAISRATLHPDWRRLCDFVARTHPRPGRLLDIGSGAGTFLAAMRLRYPAWSLTGIEPDPRAAALARRSGATVIEATLDAAPLDEREWDAVTLWNVLEHLPDPLAALRRARSLLRPGGVIYLTVPLCDSWDARLFGPYWCGWELPRHFYAFERPTLEILLRRARLRITSDACLAGIEYHVTESMRLLIAERVRRFTLRRLGVALTYSRPLRLAILPYLRLAAARSRSTALTIAARPGD